MLPKNSALPTPENDNNIKQKAVYQQLRFAQISSYCSLAAAGISTVIGFIGVSLVFNGNITTGALTSIGSFLATNKLQQIAAEANLRVDRLLQDTQKSAE